MAAAKGLWIPLEILNRRDLQMYDKIPLALVAYLDNYGGLQTDQLEYWATNLGCDKQWLTSELQRLARKLLVHKDGITWRLGPPTDDPRKRLPDLPPGVEPLMVHNGIATVFDDDIGAVRMYRCNNNVVTTNQR